jgi:hypothetical protein
MAYLFEAKIENVRLGERFGTDEGWGFKLEKTVPITSPWVMAS